MRGIGGVLAAALIVAGCGTVAPRPRAFGPVHRGMPDRIYVQSAHEREAVVASLERAGFTVADDIRDVAFVLTVRLGSRRRTRDCGSLRNIAYELRYSGVPVATVQARGWTGSCAPNMLVQSSAALAGLFAEPVTPDAGSRSSP